MERLFCQRVFKNRFSWFFLFLTHFSFFFRFDFNLFGFSFPKEKKSEEERATYYADADSSSVHPIKKEPTSQIKPLQVTSEREQENVHEKENLVFEVTDLKKRDLLHDDSSVGGESDDQSAESDEKTGGGKFEGKGEKKPEKKKGRGSRMRKVPPGQEGLFSRNHESGYRSCDGYRRRKEIKREKELEETERTQSGPLEESYLSSGQPPLSADPEKEETEKKRSSSDLDTLGLFSKFFSFPTKSTSESSSLTTRTSKTARSASPPNPFTRKEEEDVTELRASLQRDRATLLRLVDDLQHQQHRQRKRFLIYSSLQTTIFFFKQKREES